MSIIIWQSLFFKIGSGKFIQDEKGNIVDEESRFYCSYEGFF